MTAHDTMVGETLNQSVYRDLFGRAFEALWILDANMIILAANEAAAVLTGYPRERLIGQSLTLILPPDISGVHDSYVGDYLKGQRDSGVLGCVRHFDIVDAKGVKVPIALKAFRLPEGAQGPLFGAMMEDRRAQVQADQEQATLVAHLERMALTDPLTGLPNRRAFFEALEREEAVVQRHGYKTSVAVLDIDYFKAINDRYGHKAGDDVLAALAMMLADHMRRTDVIGRIGGEEFGVIMANATPEQAARTVERALQKIISLPLVPSSGDSVSVTFSAGIARLDPATGGSAALRHADAAMYNAKVKGRARVEIWSGPRTPADTEKLAG